MALAPGRAGAHALEQSYIFLRVYDDAIEGRFEIALPDLNRALGLDFPIDRSASDRDVERHIAAIEAYIRQRATFAVDGTTAHVAFTGHSLLTIRLAQFAVIGFALENLPPAPRHADIDYGLVLDTDPEHRGFLVVEHNWKTATFNNETAISSVFSPSARSQRLDLSSSSVLRGFLGLLQLGMHHIWVGIDHVLFLLALLLPSVMSRRQRQWEPAAEFRTALIHVVKIVTVFTVAHTITLSLAALETIALPGRLVESVIALSITVAAFDIICPIFKSRIWVIVFCFGLFHGFGFASVLSSMGIPPKYMVHSLLGFNLGVEAGQVVIVCIAFPLLYMLRGQRSYARFVLRHGAVGLMTVSLYWFVERAFEIDLPAGAMVKPLLSLFV